MSCVRVSKIFVFVFLSALPLPPFALRTWSSLQVANISAANVVHIRRQKTTDISDEGQGAEPVKGKMGRRLLSTQLKYTENLKHSKPTEQRPWEELNIRHLPNGSWNLRPYSVTHKKRSLINNGYQSDFTGHVDQNKVFVVLPGPDTHTAERWPSLSPEVECAGNAMTLTAHGKGYTNLLVDRVGSSPVSLFHLPPHCGYDMKHTWKDLVLRVPYDGCYILRENGSYTLPLLWWGRPVKISCPVISIPELLCSPRGMMLKVAGAGDGGRTLNAKVDDKQVPLVSSECAHPMDTPPGLLLVFAPYTAACVTVKDHHSTIVVVVGGTEFTMSCPVRLHVIGHPSSPSQSSPSSRPPPPPTTPPPRPPPPSTPIPNPAGVPVYPPLGPPYALFPPPNFPGYFSPAPLFPGYPPRTDHMTRSPPSAPTTPPPPATPPPATAPPAPTPPAPMWGYGPLMPHPYRYMGQMFPTHPLTQLDTPPSSSSSASSSSSSKTPASASDPGSETTSRLPSGPHDGHFIPFLYPHMGQFPSPPYPQPEAPATPAPNTTPPPPPPTTPPKPLPSSPALGPWSQNPLSPNFIPGHYPYAGQTFPGPGVPWFAPPGDPSSASPKVGSHSPPPPWPLFYWTRPPAPSPPEPHPGSAHSATVATQAPTTTVTTTAAPIEDATAAPAVAPVSEHPGGFAAGPMLYYPPYQAPFPVPVCPPHSQLMCAGYPQQPRPDYDPLASTTTAAPQTTHPSQGMSLLTSPVIPPSGIIGQSAVWDTETSGPPNVPSSQSSTSSSSSSSTSSAHPPSLSPSISCAVDRLVVSLPTAHPDSIQLREAGNSWVPVASTKPDCHYEVTPALQGALFSSPLPACHSRQPDGRSILSLPLRFWDIVLARYRYLDLLCPVTNPPPTTTTTTTAAPTPPPTTTTAPPTTPPTTMVTVPSTTTEGSGQWTLVPPVPTGSPSPVPKPTVLCASQDMAVVPPPGPVSALVVKDLDGNEVKVEDAPVHCGYKVIMGKSSQITIILPYNSCHVTVKDNQHTVVLRYQLWDGRQAQVQLSCPLPTPPSRPRCDLPRDHRIACTPGPVSASQCHLLGCCNDPATGACYYPMDECTGDGHFVFSVPSTILSPPLNPATLFAGGNLSCPPWRSTPDYALFKIPLDGCGAHKFEVGETVIYMVEILNTVQAVSLNYGTITRDSPVRVLVECRFLPGAVVSVGYLMKRPSLGPSIQAQGVFGVQLRIAEDHTYRAYYPQYHRPLGRLLGRPLYLEVRLLNPPDPEVVLLVHYCVAYPRSANAAWVLIYDGCPNPLDPVSQVTPTPPLPDTPRQTRRFTVSTFQFLTNEDTTKDMTDPSHSGEEIYFMCSTEVCSPSDGPCVEGCFGDSSKDDTKH